MKCRQAITRSGSNSTIRFTITYGTPNSFMRTTNLSPFAVTRSGPRSTDCTEPEPSIRLCWRGCARIANTTPGGALIRTLSET